MQPKPEPLLYEYAVIRFVPRVEREEFINIGLVMMCKRRKWARVEYVLDPGRIEALGGGVPPEVLEAMLRSIRAMAEGKKEGGEVAQFPVEERFRWLTAVKSSCLQTSRPHPGLAQDLDAEFDRIYAEQVL